MIILNLKNRIMSRIYLVYCLRQLKNPLLTNILVLMALTAVLFVFVSVPSVLSNMLNSGSFYNYFITAFFNTNLAIQTMLILVGLSAILLVKNITLETFRHRLA